MCIPSVFRLRIDYIFFLEIYANSKTSEKFQQRNLRVSLYFKFDLSLSFAT